VEGPLLQECTKFMGQGDTSVGMAQSLSVEPHGTVCGGQMHGGFGKEVRRSLSCMCQKSAQS
jgi:hypothetical protein